MIKEAGVDEINKAIVIMHEMSEDEKIQEMARLREKWIRDEVSNREFYKKQGKAEGRAEGKAEGRAEGKAEGEANKEREIISKLIQNGFTEEDIRKILNS